MEKKLIEKIGIRYEGISCGKLRRYFSWDNFKDMFRTLAGYLQAKKILKEFEPAVIFSKGGFVSLPVVFAAKSLKIPILVHESDVSPGLSNKLAFKYAAKICLSFVESKTYISQKYLKKVAVSGAPIRENILQGDSAAGYKFTGLNHHRPVILVMGGSLGARQINELTRASLEELLKKFQIVHIVGKGNLDISIHKTGYKQYEFLDSELKDVYKMCEMVITRGGANSLFELALVKKKVLVIPLETSGSRGEQMENARVFANNLGWSLLSGEITREDFISNIELTFRNVQNAEVEYKNGVVEIVKLIRKIAK